jgi:LysR family transcriptional regulator, chromosome initiation inhibitor
MNLLSSNLKAFMAVVKHKTVASAARSLHLTQAAVTLRIQGLEGDLKVDLFVRSRQGMELTPAGKQLLHYCKRSLDLEAEILPDLFGGTRFENQKWVIQGPSSPVRTRVLPLVQGFKEQFLGCSLEMQVSDLDSGVERLKEGVCDLLIAEKVHITNSFDSKLIRPEHYILVGPTAWQKRRLEEIVEVEPMIDFDPSDVMTFRFLEMHKLLNKVKCERFFVNTTDYILELIRMGVGYSVIAQEMAEPDLKAKRICNLMPGNTMPFHLAIAWRTRRQMPPSLSWLIKNLSQK